MSPPISRADGNSGSSRSDVPLPLLAEITVGTLFSIDAWALSGDPAAAERVRLEYAAEDGSAAAARLEGGVGAAAASP